MTARERGGGASRPSARPALRGLASCLALLLLLLACSPPGARALRPRLAPPVIAEAARPAAQPNSEASLQIAARQRLFDYAVTQALEILDLAVKKVQIPEYRTTLEVPVIGGIDVSISAVNITDLTLPRERAKVAIESGYYHLSAANLTAQITFNWAWAKGPLSGSGYGELALQGGSLDEIVLVRNQEEGSPPQLVAVSSAVGFGALDLAIHSYSADWLYQALLYVFSGTIKRQIEDAVDSALHTDVPNAINGLLDSLPAKVSVQGLPFDAVFTYAVYTLNYVIVKGYGEVHVEPEPAPAPSLAGASSSSSSSSSSGGGGGSSGVAGWARLAEAACPFSATVLPLSPADIGGDSGMFSMYLHEAIPNCIFWGLFQSGALHTSVQDGAIPQLRLITDLFGGLIPELPKHYPKKGMLMDIALTEPPVVSFRAGDQGSVLLSARYDTNVSVLDATGDGAALLVAQLAANVTVAADFGWASTTIHGTTVSYAVTNSAFPVNLQGWNQIIDWVVKQAGPRQSLGQLWDSYVKTPATPYVTLDAVATTAVDGWFALSSDVKVLQLPPIA